MDIKKLISTSDTCGNIFSGTSKSDTCGNIFSGTSITNTDPNYWRTPIGIPTGNWGNITSDSIYNGVFMNSDIIEYIDIFYQFMGIDMDYVRFSKMTKEEKKGFIRDLKLKKLID